MIRSVALACAVLLVAAAVAGCSAARSESPRAAPQAGMPLRADIGGSVPGALLSANTLPTIDRRLEQVTSIAARITYLSTSGVDGTVQPVTGAVFAPTGGAPTEGWPIIAFGHAASGIRPECAPSLDPMLLGASTIVTGLVKAGYVVTMTDYQGLGLDRTDHPFLDPVTEGYNVIDSVRAARKLVPNTSGRWAGFGGSQGGQAVWAANELNARYGGGLDLVGTASFAAPSDITGFADAAGVGRLTLEQRPVLVAILASLKNRWYDINLDDYQRGIVRQNEDVLLACRGPKTAERDRLVDRITVDDLRPASPEALARLRTYLQQISLPQAPASAPMLVIYGGRDELIPPAWTERALNAACGMGDVLQIEVQADRGHADVDASTAFPWINGRFRGDPPRNDCPSVAAPADQIGG